MTIVYMAMTSPPTSSNAWTKLWRYRKQGLGGMVLGNAETILAFGDALGLDADAFRADDGSVAVAFHRDEACVEVVIEPTEGMTLFEERGLGFDFEQVDVIEEISMKAIEIRLELLAGGKAWSLLGSSSHEIAGAKVVNAFQTLSSSVVPEMWQAPPTANPESPFLNWSVLAETRFPTGASAAT